MHIYAVIVDDLPKKCCECDLMAEGNGFYCAALTGAEEYEGLDSGLGHDPYSLPFRRHDCPLSLIDEHPCYAGRIVPSDAQKQINENEGRTL